jgi:hypothetical protein
VKFHRDTTGRICGFQIWRLDVELVERWDPRIDTAEITWERIFPRGFRQAWLYLQCRIFSHCYSTRFTDEPRSYLYCETCGHCPDPPPGYGIRGIIDEGTYVSTLHNVPHPTKETSE